MFNLIYAHIPLFESIQNNSFNNVRCYNADYFIQNTINYSGEIDDISKQCWDNINLLTKIGENKTADKYKKELSDVLDRVYADDLNEFDISAVDDLKVKAEEIEDVKNDVYNKEKDINRIIEHNITFDDYVDKYCNDSYTREEALYDWLSTRDSVCDSRISRTDDCFAEMGYENTIKLLRFISSKTGDAAVDYVRNILEAEYNSQLAKSSYDMLCDKDTTQRQCYKEKEDCIEELIDMGDKFPFKLEENKGRGPRYILYFTLPFTGKQISFHSPIDVDSIVYNNIYTSLCGYLYDLPFNNNLFVGCFDPDKMSREEYEKRCFLDSLSRVMLDKMAKDAIYSTTDIFDNNYKNDVLKCTSSSCDGYMDGIEELSQEYRSKLIANINKTLHRIRNYVMSNLRWNPNSGNIVDSLVPNSGENNWIPGGDPFDKLQDECETIFSLYSDIAESFK